MTNPVLKKLLAGLREQIGARHVSLLIYAMQDRQNSARILHDGEGPCLPEFASIEDAETLIFSSLNSDRAEIFQSREGHGQLVCLPNATTDEDSNRRLSLSLRPCLWLGVSGVVLESQQLAWLAALAPLCCEYFEQAYWQLDGLTGLPGRVSFERELSRHLAVRHAKPESLALMLFAPRQIDRWNHECGADEANQRLSQVAGALRASLRDTDTLCRFGGATFALLVSRSNLSEINSLAEKIAGRFRGRIEQQGLVCDLDIGARWVASTDVLQAHAIVKSADAALRYAKLRGDGKAQIFGASDIEPVDSQDPLSDIFTADLDHDYRAMRLLWQGIQQMSDATMPQDLADNVLESLKRTYFLTSGGYIRSTDAGWSLIASEGNVGELPWTEWAELGATAGHMLVLSHAGDDVLIMQVERDPLALFFLRGRTGTFTPTVQRLLMPLLSQISAAFTAKQSLREDLESQQAENARLHDTVRQIQHSGSNSKFLFESGVMRTLLNSLENVASTGETVLICGESGTGKEVLARALHSMSDLSDKPLVVVDCASIPPNLFEAELFGHTKGAYTSAESASKGYIAKADGGTLFLDEIGELPLDVQSKLLRFLQEKEIRPVGSGETIAVDVRVVAATNRNLLSEVERRNFRRDLYHRLAVIDFTIPPLRERPADVLVLARHFVENYCHLHGRRRVLSDDAEQALLRYSWPGNVRELQHSLLRAVLMSESQELEVADLNLAAPSESTISERVAATPVTPELLHERADSSSVLNDPWQSLDDLLAAQIQQCIESSQHLPLGVWLNDDLVLAAYEQAGGNAKQAAIQLGLAETTYRRSVEKVLAQQHSGLLVRTEDWQLNMPALIDALVRTKHPDDANTVGACRAVVLRLVSELLPTAPKVAASYVGVTVATYKRQLSTHGLQAA